jgi:hypothetical protein
VRLVKLGLPIVVVPTVFPSAVMLPSLSIPELTRMFPARLDELFPPSVSVLGVSLVKVVPAPTVRVPLRAMSPKPPTLAPEFPTVKEPEKLAALALLFQRAAVELKFISPGPFPLICTFPTTPLVPFKSKPPADAAVNIPVAGLLNEREIRKEVGLTIEVM